MKRIAAALVATTMLGSTTMAEEVTFAHGANPGNPRFVAAEEWGRIFTGCSGGENTVNVAPSATLGDDAEMLTSAQAGVIQVTANSQGAMSQIVPEVGLLGLPFLFKDLPSAWTILDGDIGKMIDERAQQAGLKVLGFWDNGIRQISHVSKNVPKPEDVKGMKIRTPPDQMTIDIFEALGAAPAPLAFSELPSALQSGVFDGQENPLTNIYSSKIHEITPFITLTGHKYESTPVVAGLSWWEGLDDKTKNCAMTATKDAGKMQRDLSLEADEELKPKMEAEGVTFVDADRDAYIAATKSVYEKYAAQYPDLVKALQEASGQTAQ
ncbi:TRAP transporter substrate-binding protein [Aurantimonas sp. C2-6-R+9]|uniref:TRAP transporter substrate-binding protein n=1 Tax=unclassified Aurantimonas TaxID=2638230 RepID=UPI002E1977FF|nr:MULTISPECIES: TRAP transporter substrate-binding protein [unclassified Aurantimonas]MEC5292426.1 TRAP transporter substrate-binding protein [Aurantimonas sp. C2-3-R2]MEC5382985.1 TRAP transporter substrate-binding protein [Aurantimonas sp. C2-6-R+9]MEC5413492.1 TRAP transporter substrate-binding protein [Aurantimonas sp. C2-4-R8]